MCELPPADVMCNAWRRMRAASAIVSIVGASVGRAPT